jgi:uncharacterized damage-inducible protein DinB
MTIAQQFLAELKQEAANTKLLLQAVPFDKADFKPHEKSMSLKALATHIAEINGWWKECLVQDELDFAKDGGPKKEYHSTEDIVAWHDELITKSEAILNTTDDSEFAKMWTMRSGEQIYFTLPKLAVVRTWCLNHLYHHRGQLTVYLRLLNVPVPGMYGPTADSGGM